ncbi:virulence protein [Bacillus sp. FJAT-27264]|uniref:VOC family protein n=1 Tax=Paenibacillus sp. (strain DSM 101736 / FJAT-27264) TaxID=1850362 RepID=UPI000807E537|nr:VOC family protein [Bacillus sp. FJAT-27264]OBZ18617.1 virulence protein [Bacillus sp. FJAT-27264]
MKIARFDHLVLTVRDVEASCRFYGEVLGMQIISFGKDRKAAKFGQQKINFQQVGQEIDPKAKQPTRGSGDFCLITSDSLNDVKKHLAEQDVKIELGPVERTGALGPMYSIYIRDPDENLVEISSYEPYMRMQGK